MSETRVATPEDATKRWRDGGGLFLEGHCYTLGCDQPVVTGRVTLITGKRLDVRYCAFHRIGMTFSDLRPGDVFVMIGLRDPAPRVKLAVRTPDEPNVVNLVAWESCFVAADVPVAYIRRLAWSD